MNLNNHNEDLEALDLRYKGDLHKLVGIYAYHAVYDGDIEAAEDVKQGLIITSDSSFPLHGVYFNQKYDEDVIEVVTGILSTDGFEASDVIERARNVCKEIFNIKKNQFSMGNRDSESRFWEVVENYRDEDGKPLPVRITIVTNAYVSEKKRFDINNKLAACRLSGEGFKISVEMQFGEDLESLIESDTAPFDYVKLGSLVLDKPNNYLTYGDNSIICNVSARSLKDLWKKEGKRGLLAMNLRYYVKSATIDDKIADSIFYKPDEFWYFNNGIIIVCDDYTFDDDKIVMKNFSIVNGGQTTNRIGTIPFDNDFFLSCKVVKTPSRKVRTKTVLSPTSLKLQIAKNPLTQKIGSRTKSSKETSKRLWRKSTFSAKSNAVKNQINYFSPKRGRKQRIISLPKICIRLFSWNQGLLATAFLRFFKMKKNTVFSLNAMLMIQFS